MHTFIMPLIMKENWCILIAYQTVTHVAVFVLHARCLYKQEMQAKSESIILLIPGHVETVVLLTKVTV